MIDTILTGLLLASLCATGAFFLRWQDAKAEIARLQKENQNLVTEHTKLKDTHSQLERDHLAATRKVTRSYPVKMLGEDDRH